MSFQSLLGGRSILAVGLFTIISLSTNAFAETQSGQLLIKDVHGTVSYRVDGQQWMPLKAGVVLGRGTAIRTEAASTADLILQYNGTVLRMIPDTVLSLEKLDRELTGADVITETSLRLKSGGIVGSQRKLAKPSKLDINIPSGTATIVGTEYLVRADGAVTVLSGTVSVTYNLPGSGGSVKVSVPSGFSFNPATGQVVPTTPDYLVNITDDIDTVRKNARVFKAQGATVVVKPEGKVSPTTGGNNGVGNGVDPQPPGNPPINDGPGTGPGNPGNKGGANK
jgi:hypothetical protein